MASGRNDQKEALYRAQLRAALLDDGQSPTSALVGASGPQSLEGGGRCGVV